MTTDVDSEDAPVEQKGPRRIRVAVITVVAIAVVLVSYLAVTGKFGKDDPKAVPLTLNCDEWATQMPLPLPASLSVFSSGDVPTQDFVTCLAKSREPWTASLEVYSRAEPTPPDLLRELVKVDCEAGKIPLRDFPSDAVGCVVHDKDVAGKEYIGWSIFYDRVFDERTIIRLGISSPSPDVVDMEALATKQGTTVEDLLIQTASNAAELTFSISR